jgi:hypothetical protein
MSMLWRRRRREPEAPSRLQFHRKGKCRKPCRRLPYISILPSWNRSSRKWAQSQVRAYFFSFPSFFCYFFLFLCSLSRLERIYLTNNCLTMYLKILYGVVYSKKTFVA